MDYCMEVGSNLGPNQQICRMATQEKHFTIRCDSYPWLSTSKWLTLKKACELAYSISEEAYDNDLEKWGSSHAHDVAVINHEEWTIAAIVAYPG
jgi:hypothetical protein